MGRYAPRAAGRASHPAMTQPTRATTNQKSEVEVRASPSTQGLTQYRVYQRQETVSLRFHA